MKKISLIIGATLLSTAALAQELTISVGQQGQEIKRPTNGMHMDQVHAKFGEPKDIFDPVGEPPISKWIYPDFTVYYENERVIHAVINPSEEVKPINE